MSELAPNQQSFLDRIKEQASRETWLLFVNAGFTLDDARELKKRGLIETSMQMGMPAARLPMPNRNTPTTPRAETSRTTSLPKRFAMTPTARNWHKIFRRP